MESTGTVGEDQCLYLYCFFQGPSSLPPEKGIDGEHPTFVLSYRDLGALVSPIKGLSYVEFIAPALVASAVMTAPFFECTIGTFVRLTYQKTFDAMIATPVSVQDVVTGDILYGAARAMLQGTAILAVISLFGLVHSPWALLIVPSCLLLGFVFGRARFRRHARRHFSFDLGRRLVFLRTLLLILPCLLLIPGLP